MKHSGKKLLSLLAALALLLSLLTACGGGDNAARQPGAPAPGEEAVRPDAAPPSQPEAPEPREPEDASPEDPAEPASASPEPAPGPEPTPEPEPTLEPEPEPAPAETVPEDGAYTASVTLEGGSGRAGIESPAALRCENGSFYATIVWSSSNFDYMKIDGERYDPVNTEGNSVFEIPVAAFDQKLDVIADTIAMSEPHEVEYTLYFDSATLLKQ